MNNKGFTLIELVMVVAILALIALFATPNVIRVMNRNKAENYNSTLDSILEAGKEYTSDNRYTLNFGNTFGASGASCMPTDSNYNTKKIYATVTLSTLISEGYVKNATKNFCTDASLQTNQISVHITLECKSKNFSYEIIDSGNSLKKDSSNKVLYIPKNKTCSYYY